VIVVSASNRECGLYPGTITPVPELEDCCFYLVMDLPELGTVSITSEIWGLRGRFDEYVGQTDLSG
jgi:hypothetical protein